MAESLTVDYKKSAINMALAEMYCSEDKYRMKNTDLKDKSKGANTEWYELKRNHKAKVKGELSKIY